jgi:hypothetical protein
MPVAAVGHHIPADLLVQFPLVVQGVLAAVEEEPMMLVDYQLFLVQLTLGAAVAAPKDLPAFKLVALVALV